MFGQRQQHFISIAIGHCSSTATASLDPGKKRRNQSAVILKYLELKELAVDPVTLAQIGAEDLMMLVGEYID